MNQAPEQALFLELCDRYVDDARLAFNWNGSTTVVGRGDPATPNAPPEVTIRVRRGSFFSRVLRYGNLGMGEAFMAGDFEVERGTLPAFLSILLRNRLDRKIRKDPRLALRVLRTRLGNVLRRAPGNVRRHYDIGNEVFETFLDATLTYSCGYASRPNDSLEALQANKLDRVCRKLRLEPGQRLLDIGCGFAGLLIHAAQHCGIDGTGVTISREQYERGLANVRRAGLADRVRLQLRDYRQVTGTFDRVVSVGMMEHVPPSDHRHFFRSLAGLLSARGIGLLHTIGRVGLTNRHDPFIQKYVFPASNTPALSEIAAQLERNELVILDVENIKNHYGYTTGAWLERFMANRDRLDSARFDGRFKRMWQYYLACGVAAGFVSDSAVYQVLFTNDYTAPVPLARV